MKMKFGLILSGLLIAIIILVCFFLFLPRMVEQQTHHGSYILKSAPERYPYTIRIESVTMPFPRDLDYYLSFNKLIVWGCLSECFDEKNKKELLVRELTDIERNKLKDFLANFPIDKLQKEYYPEEEVYDGGTELFSFKMGGELKQISVTNTYQKELSKLVIFVNSLVPEELHLTGYAPYK